MLSFSQRCLPLPMPVNSPRLGALVLRVARDLAAGDVEAAVEQARPAADSPLLNPGPGDPSTLLPRLRASVFANALVDLNEAGWTVLLDGSEIYVSAPNWRGWERGSTPERVLAEKGLVRRSLSARSAERMRTSGARRFISECERQDVLRLVASGPDLAAALRSQGAGAVRPVLVPARPSDGVEESTGLRLHDVFRYLRYSWSFPYESTPGRTFPFLIRDEGQPGAPVCGLLSLTSPVPRLSARDASFGWSERWVAGLVRGLGEVEDADEASMSALAERLKSAAAAAVGPEAAGAERQRSARFYEELGRCFRLEARRAPEEIARSVAKLAPEERRRCAHAARADIARDLVRDLDEGLDAVSLDGLDVDLEAALAAPEAAAERLSELASAARSAWLAERRRGQGAEDAPESLVGSDAPLYVKKRASLLAALIPARAAFEPVARALERERAPALRTALEAICKARDARSLNAALTRRRVRILSAQVADVSVCGAIPPYGPALGGKLAGLIALSADVAAAYHDAYAGRAGEIQTGISGRAVGRPGDLLGLSTTSFYPVNSAQYHRLGLPDELGGVRWSRTGASMGVGTLHLSMWTSRLAQRLLELETGTRVSGRFGEGPSERIRKLRDSLRLVGLPIEELLRHGMRRPVYTATLQAGMRPGEPADQSPYRLTGPSTDAVSEFWRSRWLEPRARTDSVIAAIAATSKEELRASRRLESPASATLAG